MIKSLATFARIHCPSEYDKYLDEKVWHYSSWIGKRLRQRIKADILNGGREYRIEDWLKECDEIHKNYQRQGSCEYAETFIMAYTASRTNQKAKAAAQGYVGTASTVCRVRRA